MNPLRAQIRDHVHQMVRAGEMDIQRPAGDPGLFGEGSEAWLIHRDFSAMLIGGVASLLTQMCHPLALAGVWDFSNWREDPHGRLGRTARFIGVTTYGGTAQAAAAIAKVRAIHDRVTGALPDGTPYAANDPALLTWVHVAEVDAFLRAHLAYREPGMSGVRQDRYLGEMAGLARKMGAGEVPATRRAVAAYFRAVRPALRYDERTRDVAAALMAQAAGGGVTGGIGQVVMQAGVELMHPWAAALHGLPTPALRRPVVRAGASAAAGVLRWALKGVSSAETPGESVRYAGESQEERVMSERELIEPHEGDKRYVRRDEKGQFKDSVDVSKSLSQDARKHAATKKPRNEGDKGD